VVRGVLFADAMNADADAGDPDDTQRRRTVASALIVGGSADFVDRCRQILAQVGVTVWNCGIESFPTLAKQRRPPIIIVIESLFASDPVRLSGTAMGLGSIVVRIPSEAISPANLESELLRGVVEAHGQRPS
jgi:hypothetical protein